MKKLLKLGLLTTAFSSYAANHEPVIYGTVVDENGTHVTGTIRWGDQEHFLSDIFNGNKIAVVGIEHMTDDEIDELEDHQPGPQARIGGIQVTFKSFFGNDLKRPYYNIPFGAIAKLTIDDKNSLYTATLHDGTEIKSNGDSNDLSDEVYVLSKDGKTHSFDLDDLTEVNFSQAPEDAPIFDQGIFGTVTTTFGTFKGRIMWDQDERVLSEELDGYENGVEHEIKFANIKSLERKDNETLVFLNDGNSLLLGGTNDVDRSNRGIYLDNPILGRIDIQWRDFNKLVIEETDVKWMTYSDYKNQTNQLAGKITLTDGSILDAEQIAFDLNQQSSGELIEVEVDKSERQIPLRNIKLITNIPESGAELLMSDSTKLNAFGSRSVNRDNNGLMVKNNNKHQWIRWDDVSTIEFN